MYNRQPCVTDDSYQLSYEHLRQLECASHFRSSAEISPFKFVSGKQQVSDGEKECFNSGADVEASLGAGDYHTCSVAKDMEFRMRTDDTSVITASVLDRALNSSLAAESFLRTEVVENGKRPSSHLCSEVVNKRARKESEAGKLEHFDGNSFVCIAPVRKLSEEAEWTRATAGVDANGKSFEAGYEVDRRKLGLDQLEDVCFQFSEHSHWRHVPVGPDHQADLPKWSSRESNLAPGNATTSYADRYEASADKWLGTCVMPMPDCDSIVMEVQSCCPKIVCDCADEGSIRCVRMHVMAAREKLIRALGHEQFIQMGFSHMGEIVVAQRWTEEEENLFHEVVLSNPASVGRNFWAMLSKVFPSCSSKELVSYYFNVFILRKRAHQNRFDRSNVDSDNDEWQESGDVEFAMSEEENSVVESPSDGNILSIKNDASEVEHEEHLVGTEEDEGCKEFKSKSMPAIQPIDRNSTDSAEDQDIQDDSCTSYEGLNNFSGVNGFGRQCNHVERHHDNFLECRNGGILNLADYEHTDGHGDSKPWKINHVGSNNKDVDFFPTCIVIEEEVFGKGSPGKAANDGSGFS